MRDTDFIEDRDIKKAINSFGSRPDISEKDRELILRLANQASRVQELRDKNIDLKGRIVDLEGLCIKTHRILKFVVRNTNVHVGRKAYKTIENIEALISIGDKEHVKV